jgi:HSP20 family protein
MAKALTRWAPSDLWTNRMNRMFDDAFSSFLAPLVPSEQIAERAWMPAVDIRETDDSLMLTAELPGMKKDDVHITFENNVLTLSGERKFEKDEKRENYHRIERAYGEFSRSFSVPTNIDPTKVEAKFKDGVLEVKLAKSPEARPRKIEIT